MSDGIRFVLDGEDVEARPGESIWQVANRRGVEIPHLCYLPAPGYRPDGHCRACMVEIEGERVLAASCVRRPAPGMKVQTASERARTSRKLVFELLATDQPERGVAHDPNSAFWTWADRVAVADSRFPVVRRSSDTTDLSHPAMAVQLDACIHCTLCVRACREVQVNDVIGMASRGPFEKIVFDFDDPMGMSTCVACGECVQACPTGALMEKSLVDERGVYANAPDREVDSVCPYCASAASSPTRSRTTASSPSRAATGLRTRTGFASKAASASTSCTTGTASPYRSSARRASRSTMSRSIRKIL